MSTGKIQVYYGAGRGKTSAALGYAIHEASKGEIRHCNSVFKTER